MCVKTISKLGQGNTNKRREGFTTWKERIGINLIPVPLASTTSFTERYAKPSRAITLTSVPCWAMLACSEVKTWDQTSLNSGKSLVLSHKSRCGAREGRQWACPKFISVVCGISPTFRQSTHSSSSTMDKKIVNFSFSFVLRPFLTPFFPALKNCHSTQTVTSK